MKIIIRGRQTGKTTELINECYDKQGYIVCHDLNECKRIFNLALGMGKNIPMPISYREFLYKRYYGRGIKNFHIDNVDMLLRYIASAPIETVTINKEPESNEMKRPKRAVVDLEIIKTTRYSYRCPHCKTYNIGGFDDDCIRIRCGHCEQEVILDYSTSKNID